MAGDKREIVLDLLARDKSGAATKSFAKNLTEAGNAADKAGEHAEDFGRESEQAARKADKLGDQATGTARDIAKLDREIALATAELGFLAKAFARTEDAAERLDISKTIRKGENDIRRMSKSKGLLQALLPDPEPADVVKFTTKLGDAVTKAAASTPATGLAAAIIGVAFAPTIGAAIAGGVVGGIGIGGIVGGFALAAKDPAVSGYAKRIGAKFSTDVQKEAKDAFGGPVKSSLMALEALASRSAPKIGKIFDNSAPGVNKLTDAIVGAGDALLDSFVNASAKSGPAMDALGHIVQATGESVADFITMLASHSDEGASALEDINTALQNTITITSGLVDAAATVKGWSDSLDDAIDKSRSWLEDQSGIIDLTADGYKKGSEAALLYRDGVIGAAGAANDYEHYVAAAADRTNKLAAELSTAERAARGEQGALQDLSNEMRAQTDPVFGLLNAQDQLRDAQKKVADATRDHGKKSKEAKSALRDLAEAAINLEGKAGALGATFNGKLTPELRATLRAAGLTEGQINQLAGQFASAKKAGQSFAKTYKATAKVANADAARSALYGVRDAANSIPRAVTIAMRITGTTSVSKAAASVRKQYARATGGPVAEGTPYWVGENGPELVLPASNGRVLSAAASRGSNASVAAHRPAAVNGPQTLRIELAGPQETVTMFRNLVRTANLLQG